jgi:hypothetical protein
LTPLPGRFTSGTAAVFIVEDDWWAPGVVRTGVKKTPAPIGVQTPDHPARSEFLNRLSRRGHRTGTERHNW